MSLLQKLLIGVFMLIMLLFAGAALLFNVAIPNMMENSAQKVLDEQQAPITDHFTQVGEHRIHYVSVGADSLPVAVMVHGSPGVWKDNVSILTDSSLYNKVRLIALDRPGYGETGGSVVANLKTEAAILIQAAEAASGGRPATLVGHSYGGPLIGQMAADFPQKVKGLILVASSMDPRLEEMRWYNKVAKIPPVSWILPDIMLNSNKEMIKLKDDLALLEPRWKELTMPVTVLQGMKDMLVYPENADFAERHIVNAQPLVINRIPDTNHFIPFTKGYIVRDAILEQIGL